MSVIAKVTSFIILCSISLIALAADELPLYSLKLPKGFSINIFAEVPNARSLALGAKGTVFVGNRTKGDVYAIVPNQQHPANNRVIKIASDLDTPNGVAFYDGALYVAENSRIIKYPNIEAQLEHPPQPIVISTALPNKSHHGWRYIKFGPDGKLYIGVGAPCNNCLSEDKNFATIMRMNADGSHFEIYAHGIRNTVGFAWHPTTKQLWFTDNGRDLMGDDIPPDELNVATKQGEHFGYPYCHGKNIADPTYGKLFPCSHFVAPKLELPAHVAALGMLFYTGNMFPGDFQQDIFIAEHGSWNRSKKDGYQVISVKFENNKFVTKPFVTGWMKDEKEWGRPVDLLQMPDGSMLISDDYAGVVYRVSYKK